MAYQKQTWVDGSTGGTPINSTRLNYMEDGIEGAYYTDTYSTTETKTNKVWIDGKPIYRKVYTGTTGSSGSVIIDSNINKNNALINCGGYVENSSGNKTNIGAYLNSDYYNGIFFDNNEVRLFFSSYLNNSNYVIWLEYTKLS